MSVAEAAMQWPGEARHSLLWFDSLLCFESVITKIQNHQMNMHFTFESHV